MENSLEIITEKSKWGALLSVIKNYDFYHTYDYHQLSKKKNEIPVLIKYQNDNSIIALPLLIREIEGTCYKDATSVYGYSGPIMKNISENFDNSIYIKKINNYFSENNIISIFSRLNPYIPYQNQILKNYGSIKNQGKVVNIDLTLDSLIQRQKYQSSIKTQVNKARRELTIKKAVSKKDLSEFIYIYNENMNRVNAKRDYYFDEDYFLKIIDSQDFETEILLAIHNETNEVIGGSMFIKTNFIIQYHLSGTKDNFLHLRPSKLLIDEMRLRTNNKEFIFFNLGGGLGGSDSDSLFLFKSGFSKDFKSFDLWTHIINNDVYNNLVKKNNVISDTAFFPKYRHNKT